MIRFAANLSMLFQEVSFLERFALARQNGFDFVEFLFPYDYSTSVIKELLQEHKLKIELFNMPPGAWAVGERGLAALPGREDEFQKSVDLALSYALELGVKKLHCMAGLCQEAGPDSRQSLWQAQYETYLGNLSRAARIFQQHDIALLIEPLNPFSLPNYFLSDFFQAQEIIDKIENLYLQFDVFHCQQIHGNITHLLDKFFPITKHYQIAGVPDRFEPDTGELNYPYILQKIDALGYQGAIGCEYRPEKNTVEGLKWMEFFITR